MNAPTLRIVLVFLLCPMLPCASPAHADSGIDQALKIPAQAKDAMGALGTQPPCENDIKTEIVRSPRSFSKILGCPRDQIRIRAQGLVGRVLKGKKSADFETLSNDPSRKIIFLMGEDGLEGLPGLGADQILIKIGYTPEYIDRLREEGYQFKLVVFESENEAGVPATWDNVIRLAQKEYPELSEKLKKQLPALKRTRFSEVESQAPTPFSKVDQAGEKHPEYINAQKLASRKGTLWEVRAFLYYQSRLTEYFSGDGMTRSKNGEPRAREMIAPNRRVSTLKNAAVIDLDSPEPCSR